MRNALLVGLLLIVGRLSCLSRLRRHHRRPTDAINDLVFLLPRASWIAEDYAVKQRTVTANDSLTVDMASGGGFALIVEP